MAFLNVSKATIRRDFEKLHQQGKIAFVHGGAESVKRVDAEELPYYEKSSHNNNEKTRIAELASKYIIPNSTIFIDTGTTLIEMCPFIRNIKNLRVLTNDVAVAYELTKSPNLEVTVIGGKLRNGYYTLMGYFAEAMIKKLRADVAFLSTDAISPIYGCMITNIDELVVKQAIHHCADKKILLADHTKFSKEALVTTYDLKSIDLFITGREVSGNEVGIYKEMGLAIVLA